jgi:hypothetical protein
MAEYTVTQRTLDPIDGVHHGTGTRSLNDWVLDPASVAGSGPLAFVKADMQTTTMLFEIDAPVVPNWFGVAVPSGITSFTDPVLYFHPTPGQAGYVDADYAGKTGKWPELFHYMDTLGLQVDPTHKNRVMIMPFLTQAAAADTGMLPGAWQDVLTQILRLVRAAMNADDGSPLSMTSLAVASYSVGIAYSDTFRRRAAGLSPLLREVWDFDGTFSTNAALSAKLQATAALRVTKYDQLAGPEGASFHVPIPRWSAFPAPPTDGGQVHWLAITYLVTHAAWLSPIGARTSDVA